MDKFVKLNVDLPYVQFAEADDIWVRTYTLEKAGYIVPQHAHEHDHITLLSNGSVEAWKDNETMGIFNAPAMITIPAGSKHRFKALTDHVLLSCLHNLRGTGLKEPKIQEKHTLAEL
jgi:quercetin dioxygenase-like cupin family protein